MLKRRSDAVEQFLTQLCSDLGCASTEAPPDNRGVRSALWRSWFRSWAV